MLPFLWPSNLKENQNIKVALKIWWRQNLKAQQFMLANSEACWKHEFSFYGLSGYFNMQRLPCYLKITITAVRLKLFTHKQEKDASVDNK